MVGRDAADHAQRAPVSNAQLRITDLDGLSVTAFVTHTGCGQLPDLELRHRRRAGCDDHIRCAKDTGLTNLPPHDFAQNQIWCAVVALAWELTAWMQSLALHGHPGHEAARRWKPKRLRVRLISIPPGTPAQEDAASCTLPRPLRARARAGRTRRSGPTHRTTTETGGRLTPGPATRLPALPDPGCSCGGVGVGVGIGASLIG